MEHVETEERRRRVRGDSVERLHVEGMHRHDVAMRTVPGRRACTDETEPATVVAEGDGSGGQDIVVRRAAPAGSSVTEAGMFATAQCQNPDAVGASGSNTVTTKLFVSAGKPDHES